MSKKVLWGVIGFVIVILGYLYATPYITLYSIKNAAKAGDSEKVSAYIDYPSVRQSFKDQMNAYMVKEMASKETNGWEALGAMMASAMVEKMVDAIVTPEGMTLMLQGKDLKGSLSGNTEEQPTQKFDDSKIDYQTRYLSMNLFEVAIKNKDTQKDLKIIMERDGLSWKVKKIVVPMDDKPTVKPQEELPELSIAPTPDMDTAQVVINETEDDFDILGVQMGSTLESCFNDPCSLFKVKYLTNVSKSPNTVGLDLTVIRGKREIESDSIDWVAEPEKIHIQCSKTDPLFQMGDQSMKVPLMKSGVPDEMRPIAEYYMQACHNYTGDMDAGIQKYGYDVKVQ